MNQPGKLEMSSLARRISALVVITIIVLAYRRPDQFLHPYIWVEDGTLNLSRYAVCGIRCTFWLPIAGFFELIPKLIAIAAFKISIFHAPQISVALTVCFTSAVV